MNAQEFAALITGREYPFRLTNEESQAAQVAGLVVVYGASDDLMEFDGVFRDEISCYGGGMAYLNKEGLLANDCESDECPHFAKLKAAATKIKALWCAEADNGWTYETEIPHASFNIVEEGDAYCRGIVFRLADVEGGAA